MRLDNFKMKYGRGYKEFCPEADDEFKFIQNESTDSLEEECEIIKSALSSPVQSKRLRESVKKGDKVCIIISDITRSWQRMQLYLPFIVDELNSAGVKDEQITFLCATGSHRRQSLEEHRILLGEELFKRFKVIDHDCTDEDNLEYLGETSFKTPVYINRLAVESDFIIITGGIVYHDMAGWGGGRKSILPGISGYRTIMGNHSLCLNSQAGHGRNPLSRSGNLKDNPMHLDMIEACELVKPSFLFNVIINDNGYICGAVAGDYIKAHEKGCGIVQAMDEVKIAEWSDLVIASAGGYPKDINLYQASKALSNAREAVKAGGSIILLAECVEGIGDDEVSSIIQNFKTNLEREMELRRNFTIAKYTGYLICEIAEKHRVILVSSLPGYLLQNIGISIVSSLEDALKLVLPKEKHGRKIYLMPSAGSTLPTLIGEDKTENI